MILLAGENVYWIQLGNSQNLTLVLENHGNVAFTAKRAIQMHRHPFLFTFQSINRYFLFNLYSLHGN